MSLLLISLINIVGIISETIIIDTQLGRIQGTVNKKAAKQTVYSFYGIKYALSPTGTLRFRPAQLNETKWDGIYDGTTFGDVCMQALPPNGQPMSENCLFLNIWTPKPNNTGTLLPVMFWIHGGGFTAGAGSANSYNGVNLVGEGKDFVYVSINYRLGAFGFLSNEQLYNEDENWKSYGGLNGIYDQVQSLNWVKKYINDYGGDASQITIFGESAGGLSVCTLCISPLAKNLFSRAIIESGSCIGPWEAGNTSFALDFSNGKLQSAGYPINNLTYLRSIPATQFQNSMQATLWVTGVDDKVLLDQPVNLYTNLSNNPLNADKIIIGFNSMDGIIGFPWHAGPRPTTDAEYKQFLNRYVTNQTQANLLYSYYYPPSDFPPYPPNHNSFELAWFTITGDNCLTCPSLFLGDEIDQQSKNNMVYIYYFGGPGKNGSYYAPHASELPFVFDAEGSNTFFDMPWDQTLSNEMVSSWTNFAKYGFPNVTDSINSINIEWTLYDGSSNKNVMIFEDKVTVKTSFETEYRKNVCEFWYYEVGIDVMVNICLDGSINATHTQ